MPSISDTDTDTELRDRQDRDRLIAQTRRDDGRRRVREGRADGGRRLTANVQTIDRVADRVANDVNALVRAWSASNAETFKGVVTIAGNIALDLFGGGRRAVRDAEDRYDDRYGDERYDDDRDYRARYDADDRRPPARRTRDGVEDAGDGVAGFTRSVGDALTGAASVVTRSSRRFQEEFDAAQEDADSFDRDLGRPDPREDARRHELRDDDRTARDAEQTGAQVGADLGAAVDDATRGPRGRRTPPA